MPRKAIEISFRSSQRRYEKWLRAHLGEIWKKDLDKKHKKMRRKRTSLRSGACTLLRPVPGTHSMPLGPFTPSPTTT